MLFMFETVGRRKNIQNPRKLKQIQLILQKVSQRPGGAELVAKTKGETQNTKPRNLQKCIDYAIDIRKDVCLLRLLIFEKINEQNMNQFCKRSAPGGAPFARGVFRSGFIEKQKG